VSTSKTGDAVKKKASKKTISSAPQIRNQVAESRQFVPTNLRVRRDQAPKPIRRPVVQVQQSQAQQIPQQQPVSADKSEAYDKFMAEMAELI